MPYQIDKLEDHFLSESGSNRPANPTKVFEDAYNFYNDTINDPAARMRQVEVAVDGFVVGGLKEIPNQLVNHPVETAEKALVAGATAAAFGAVMATGSPALMGSALLAGGILTGAGLANSYSRMTNDGKLASALSHAWTNSAEDDLSRCKSVAENKLGIEAFDFALTAAFCTGGGALGGKLMADSLAKPKWNFYPPREWTKGPDGIRTYESPNFGGKDTLFKDGTLKTERFGTTTTHHANGPTVTEYPNGVKQTEFKNGAVETIHADGRKVTLDGRRSITELPNGTKITESPWLTIVEKPDGTSTNKQIDGYIWKKFPNGDTRSATYDGRTEFYDAAQQKLYITKPNGEKIVWE
ncbi:MAG: hypothetical protein JST89_04170 [Cyanobacteria bacterium SZAS-4]|nr:hypothetical protein [Cyanobacteria bacterium SZAS-4]